MTSTAWGDEVYAAALLVPRPAPVSAAVSARSWSVNAAFLASVTAQSAVIAHQLSALWPDPAAVPKHVVWAAEYLAGQVYLGHLRSPQAAHIMVDLVRRWGGVPVSVTLSDVEPVDADGYVPDYRGRL